MTDEKTYLDYHEEKCGCDVVCGRCSNFDGNYCKILKQTTWEEAPACDCGYYMESED